MLINSSYFGHENCFALGVGVVLVFIVSSIVGFGKKWKFIVTFVVAYMRPQTYKELNGEMNDIKRISRYPSHTSIEE